MLAQNRMPAANTKWQALFNGVSLAQPATPTPPTTTTTPMIPMYVPPSGAEVAVALGISVVGMAVGIAISYGVCCLGMRNCR